MGKRSVKKGKISKKKVFYLNLILLFSLILLVIILNLNIVRSLDFLIAEKIPKLWSLTAIQIMLTISFFADLKILVFLSLVILLVLFFRKEKKNAFFFSITMLSSAILTQIIKLIVARPRPELSVVLKDSYSFPSSHAVLSVVFFSLVIYLFKDDIRNKFTKIVFIITNILLITLVGFSRVYLNAHWLSDVLAGFALGLFLLLFSLNIFKSAIQNSNHD